MFERQPIPAFSIVFVAVAQLNIRITLMIKTNPSKCKILIIRSKNDQISIYTSLNPIKMSYATATFVVHRYLFFVINCNTLSILYSFISKLNINLAQTMLIESESKCNFNSLFLRSFSKEIL